MATAATEVYDGQDVESGHSLPPGFRRDTLELSTEQAPSCPVCKSLKRTHFASGHDYELQTCSNEWHFWRCAACNAVWLDPRPTTTALDVIYPRTYYAYNRNKTPWMVRKGKDVLDRIKFNNFLRRTGFPSSFLDIGCGDGRYLDLFEGWGLSKDRIYGLDFSEKQVRRLRQRGYQVYQGRVEDCAEIATGSIDLATMFHVIEHVADPVGVMNRIVEWLSPGGSLVVETPNLDSWDARLFKQRWWGGYHIPRHWTLFDANSLRRLFEQCGLSVQHCAYQTGHGSWMNSFHHLAKYNSRIPSSRLADWFELPKGLPMLITFTGFDIIRRTMGARTSTLLMLGQKS
ncbi:MAG TPA: class I SAM-dependent methyltransferase [Xanthobacteraceae bacterium]|jgi:SAM-dependent methyltransferase